LISRQCEIKIKMHFLFFFLLINTSHSFLQFPFSAHSLLDKVLNTVQYDEKIILTSMINGTECFRECKPNDVKICHFDFVLKYFYANGG
jgi:hypothetical protein